MEPGWQSLSPHVRVQKEELVAMGVVSQACSLGSSGSHPVGSSAPGVQVKECVLSVVPAALQDRHSERGLTGCRLSCHLNATYPKYYPAAFYTVT